MPLLPHCYFIDIVSLKLWNVGVLVSILQMRKLRLKLSTPGQRHSVNSSLHVNMDMLSMEV